MNYSREFYKQQIRDYNGFFKKDFTDDEKLNNLEAELSETTKKVADIQDEIKKEQAKKYNSDYKRLYKNKIYRYTSRKGDELYFDFLSGQKVSELNPEIEYEIQNLEYKNGFVSVIDGYAYELGGLVLKKYKYRITAGDEILKLTLVNEAILPIIEPQNRINWKGYISLSTTMNGAPDEFYIRNALEAMDAQEFVNNFYDISRNLEGVKMNVLYEAFLENANTEVILKLAPDSIVKRLLLTNTQEKKNTIADILGVNKSTYDLFIKEGLETNLYVLKEYIKNKDTFNLTDQEWVNIINKAKEWENDLDFYSIQYKGWGGGGFKRAQDNSYLLFNLAIDYQSRPEFNKNYSFGKFCNYVVFQTINQGFTAINYYSMELRDYIYMCNSYGAKPNLYTSTIKLTHDIATRNHNLKVTPEEETKFKEKYTDFKETKIGDYVITAPEKTKDLQDEGDALSHCVASYIKRIINGETMILFLRKALEKDTSLLTLEIKDDKIIQARGASNRNPYEEEIDIIKKYAEKNKLDVAY